MDKTTNGFAMVFLHELQHTKLGGNLEDTKKMGAKGDVVERINIMLGELNLPQRESYSPMDAGAGTYMYIPYSKEAKKSIKNGKHPSDDMPHVKINKLKIIFQD